MFGKCCSSMGLGCVAAIVLIVGVGGYVINAVRSGQGLKAFLGSVNRPYLKIEAISEDSAISKLEIFEKALEENSTAELILTEAEASYLLNRHVTSSEDSGMFIFRNVTVDFEPDRAYIYADGMLGSEFKAVLQTETEGENIYPKVKDVRIGKISSPGFISNNISGMLEQGVEQLKTSNFGGRKIKTLRFMRDSVIIEMTKV